MADLEDLRKRFYSNDDDDFLFDAPAPKQPEAPGPQAQRKATSRTNARASSSTHHVDENITRHAPDRMDVDTAVPDILLPKVSDETDLQQLMRHWQNERHAPDILQSQDALLSRILDQIRRQVGSCYFYLVC